MQYFFSMEGSTSSEDCVHDVKEDNENTVLIPLPTSSDVEFMPFQNFRCYGVDVEFPKDRIPFTAQRSVMTLVRCALSFL